MKLALKFFLLEKEFNLKVYNKMLQKTHKYKYI